MARGWNACALLVLAASALLTVSADYFTTDAIQGMIDSNCLYTSNPPAGAPVGTSHGLDHAGCASCINGFTTPSSTAAEGAKVEACFNVCQDPQNQLPGLTLANADQCVDCLTAANRDICSVCLSLSGADATDCMAYWTTGTTSIDVADTTAEAAYVWAVGECFKYPDTNGVRANCLSCLEGYTPPADDAQYFGKCIDAQQQAAYIAAGDWAHVNGIYAMCGAAAYAPVGLTRADCYTCMTTVEATIAATTDDTLKLQLEKKPYGCAQYCMPEVGAIAGSSAGTTLCTECLAATTPADAWACGNCASVPSPNGAKQACYDCVKDDPYEGHTSNFNWACAECSKIQNTQLRALCMQCIRSQPEYGAKPDDNDTTSDAYKKYLAFVEHTEANICSCVDLTFHAGTTDLHPGVITVSVNRTLDAFELKCFMPQYTYDAAGALVTPPIPWGDNILPYYGLDGNIYIGDPVTNEPKLCTDCTVNGGPNPAYGGATYAPTTACVECVDATYRSSAPLYPKQYACSEYCQDPATIKADTYTVDLPDQFGGTGAIVSEGQDCSDCVTDNRILDPSDCKACIAATNGITDLAERASRRRECFFYVRSPRVATAPASPGGKRSLQADGTGSSGQTTPVVPWPNFAWGASQCAQFDNKIARAYCYACLLAGCEDPCDCVDAARRANSTSVYSSPCDGNPPPPGDTLCDTPKHLWFWTWVPQFCDSDCLTGNKLPAPTDPNFGNWKSRTISQFDWRIIQRTTPNDPDCTDGGGPLNSACGWTDIFPQTTPSSFVPVVGSNVLAYNIAPKLSDKLNVVFYDVFAVRIDVGAISFPTNAQCIAQAHSGVDCQFFLVVKNAEAVTGANGPAQPPTADLSVKNYTPVKIAWDNTQVPTLADGLDTGFQDNGGNFLEYNGIAIELDSCKNQLLYTSLAPSKTELWTGSGASNLNIDTNTVYRMFSVFPPQDHTGTEQHPTVSDKK